MRWNENTFIWCDVYLLGQLRYHNGILDRLKSFVVRRKKILSVARGERRGKKNLKKEINKWIYEKGNFTYEMLFTVVLLLLLYRYGKKRNYFPQFSFSCLFFSSPLHLIIINILTSNEHTERKWTKSFSFFLSSFSLSLLFSPDENENDHGKKQRKKNCNHNHKNVFLKKKI